MIQVMPRGVGRVFAGMRLMRLRQLRVVSSLVMIAGIVVLRGFSMMMRGQTVMVRGLTVFVGCLL